MQAGQTIPEKLFFRIGEVCDLIKVQPHVLRYWETEFPMLTPQKNRAGQRVYRRKDVEMVMRIRNLLYEEKFTIAGAKKKLLDESHKPFARSKPDTSQLAAKDAEPQPQADSLFEPYPESSVPEVIRVADIRESIQVAAPITDRIVTTAPPEVAPLTTPPANPAGHQALLVDIRRGLEDLLTLLKSEC